MTGLFRLKINRFLLLFCGIFLSFSAFSTEISTPRPASFLEFRSISGHVLPRPNFLSDISHYQAFSLRFARASNGTQWEDFAFNMPFFGVGFYKPFFANNPGLGSPFSIYLFRGSTIHQFTNNLGLGFEMNLGLSMNWNPHDPFDNPYNLAIGSPSNVHVGLRFYLEYALPRNLDLRFGIDLNHFSNGAGRRPNAGVNMGGLNLSLAYNFNPPPQGKGALLRNPPLFEPPQDIPPRIDHTVQFIVSSRQSRFPPDDYNNLLYDHVDRNFTVLGLAYSPMFTRGFRYKWGPSVRLVYDESSRATVWREEHPKDGQLYYRVKRGSFGNRFSLGLGLKGEITTPVVSFFGKLGYSVYHRHHNDSRFYQVLGIKAYLQGNFFATFGISATQFSVAQYLYWSFGYTLSREPSRKTIRRNRNG